MFTLGEDGLEAEVAENLGRVAIVDAVDDAHDSACLELPHSLIDSILGQLILLRALAGGFREYFG